jgi:tetratricopeptide (TPR) repeat protein
MEPAAELPVIPDPTSDEPRSRRWRPRLAWIALSLELGLLIGFGLQTTSSDSDGPATAAAVAPEEPSNIAKAAKAAPKGLYDLDELIRAGDYRSTLRVCQNLVRDAEDKPDDGLRYRQGLCLEGLSRCPEAIEVLRPLADRPTPTAVTAAARLAVARCAIRMGRSAEARSALDPVFLPSAPAAFASPRVVGEAGYLAALLTGAALPPAAPAGPHDDSGPASLPVPLAPDYALDLVVARPVRPRPDRPIVPLPAGDAGAAWSRALEAAPDHPLNSFARLELANLEFRQGRLREALAGYDLLLTAARQPAEARAAAYNLGVVRFRLGAFAAARQAFLQVIDRGPADRWAALAWWWTGRSYLDAGEPRLALSPFRRAAATGTDTEVAGLAVLATAAAHLLDGDASRANATLRMSRGRLTADSHRTFAALLDTLARTPAGSGPPAPGRPDANELLDAALGAGGSSPIGPAGTYWLGQAYRRYGLDAPVAKLYEQALPSCRGVLAVRMTLAVAEYHFENGHADEAKSRYQAVAAIDRGPSGALALHRLAELALRAGRTGECLAYCQTALTFPDVRRDQVLRTMGQAHERSGDVAQAIRCYAGIAPGR